MTRLAASLLWLRRALSGAWPVFAAASIAVMASMSPWWRSIELKGFDVLTRLTAPGPSTLPITLISIDEASIAALGQQWPWPRSIHARLLERLKEAQVAVVAFDVLFSEAATDAGEDQAFERAIRASGPVVLAANLEYRETAASRLWVRIDPLRRFVEAGAVPGLATVELDRDGFLRRFPVSAETLWRQVVLQLDALNPGVVASFSADAMQRIRYLSGAQSFAAIPYYRMLDPGRHLAPGWKEALRDNIVLVGRTVKASTEIGAAQSDLFFTPFFPETGEMMPGIEIHANLIANMVTGSTLHELPAGYAYALLLLATLCAATLMSSWQPWRSALAASGLMAGVALGGAALFSLGYWLPSGVALLLPPLAYLAQGGRAFYREQTGRREIRRAFAQYVSPAVVEAILANPERLRLGGERCELTVMFSDLAGFTAIAENMSSDEVARLLNRHLSDMTEIVMRHGGTVDKFIGDSVMAFWGAPIADSEQSRHALAAAVEMQEASAALRDEIAAGGGPLLKVRIGINRGECVVGNMGGRGRFSYTAVGDSVNLASRLEGVNKVYGTGILLSGRVVSELGEAPSVRLVDTIKVVGKSQAVDIYTPCSDAAQGALSDKALSAYRRGDIDAARTAWRLLAKAFPADPLPDVFLARLGEWAVRGVPSDWDGVTTLREK